MIRQLTYYRSRRSPAPVGMFRRSFTLIELLVTITVFVILCGIVASAVIAAEREARRMKTQDLVTRLHTLIMSKWSSYATRRVPVNTVGMTPNAANKLRVDGLRELMRMELPERFSDISDFTPKYLATRPAVNFAYLSRLNASKKDDAFQGAECLYMIVTVGLEDSEGKEYFREGDIGDVDGDGLPEFLDGWGYPISFLRWAPGFLPSELQNSDAVNNHDPFDPNKVYANAYALFPLIYSAGPDGIYDINTKTIQYSALAVPNNPFDGTTIDVGKPMDLPSNGQPANGEDNSIDNIHNHILVID